MTIQNIIPLASAADDLNLLLRVVADPATHKARLDELVAHQKAVDEKIAALNEMAGDTRRLPSAAEAAGIVSNNRKGALDDREADLDHPAKQVGTAQARKRASGLHRRR